MSEPVRSSARTAGGLLHASGFVLLLALIVFLLDSLVGGAPPLPWSDESAHLVKAVELQASLRDAAGVSWLHHLLFSIDAYPNFLYGLSQLWMGELPLVPSDLRRGMVLFPLAHALTAMIWGRRLWGMTGTWVYLGLAVLSPMLLSVGRLYLLDVALVAAVGMGLILLAASDGFRRPGPTAAFALCAVIGLNIKWMWLVFMAVPVAANAARAILASGQETRARGLLGGAVLASFVAACLLVYLLGTQLPQEAFAPYSPWAILPVTTPLLAVIGGLAWLLWALLKPAHSMRPVVQVLLLLLIVLLGAGPTYVIAQEPLWERLATEESFHALRPDDTLLLNLAGVRHILQAPELWLALVLLPFSGWRRRVGALSWGLLGLALPAVVVAFALPYDPRYLLPLAPIAAMALVSAWITLPARLAQLATVACLGLSLGGSVGPILVDRGLATEPGTLREKVYLRDFGYDAIAPLVSLTWSKLEYPSPLSEPVARELVTELRSHCEPSGCLLSVQLHRHRSVRARHIPSLDARSVHTLARLQGIPVALEGENNGAEAPQLALVADCREEADPSGSLWHMPAGSDPCLLVLRALP